MMADDCMHGTYMNMTTGEMDPCGMTGCPQCEKAAEESPVRAWVPSTPPDTPFFGVARRMQPGVFLRQNVKPPPWRRRIYRAWRALLGDFG